MKNHAFLITMSTGDPLPIDRDELEKILRAISTKQACVLRSGIFNPSFYVSVVKDRARTEAFHQDIKYLQGEERKQAIEAGPRILKNIFGDEIKQLVEKMQIGPPKNGTE